LPLLCVPEKKSPPQRAVSRILSAFARFAASYGATIIPLAPSLLTGSSGLPGGSDGPSLTPPYLALLRAGFCLPPVLPRARCALTAPFHPYLSAVYFLCHCPSGRPDRELPGALPYGVRTFLPSTHLFEVRSGQAHCGPVLSEPRRGESKDDRLACCGGTTLLPRAMLNAEC
jgi:hypothetical protein